MALTVRALDVDLCRSQPSLRAVVRRLARRGYPVFEDALGVKAFNFNENWPLDYGFDIRLRTAAAKRIRRSMLLRFALAVHRYRG